MKHIILFLSFFVTSAWAVDNPDAPDYVADFESRILPYEEYIHKEASTTFDYSKGYRELYGVLDKELNSAYKQLMSRLPKESKNKLRLSQKQWMKFRDSEFIFISNNFNKANFGSSSTISRGNYRTSIVKSRIMELLWYLKNYS